MADSENLDEPVLLADPELNHQGRDGEDPVFILA
jgi:hypothetical protein